VNILVLIPDRDKAEKVKEILERALRLNVEFAIDTLEANEKLKTSKFDLFACFGFDAKEILGLNAFAIQEKEARPAILAFPQSEEDENLIALRLASSLIPDESLDSDLRKSALEFLNENVSEREAGAKPEAKQRNAEELSRLIEIAAHEIRHPATVFKGYSYILREQASELTPEIFEEALTSIEQASDRLAHLVNELLDTARIESGKADLCSKEISPEAIILRAVREMEMRGYEGRFSIEESEEEFIIHVDAEKIKMAISAILDNAARYSPPESKVIIGYERSGNEAIFRVSDTGSGIRKDEIGKIFQPFFKGSAAIERKMPGLGLGLYIAKSYVEMHGGWIEAKQKKGGGTVFVVGIPIESSDQAIGESGSAS